MVDYDLNILDAILESLDVAGEVHVKTKAYLGWCLRLEIEGLVRYEGIFLEYHVYKLKDDVELSFICTSY